MGAVATYLVDTSVLVRQAKRGVADRILPLSNQALIALCPIVQMEVMAGARNPADRDRFAEWFRHFETLTTPDHVWDRAIEVQNELVGIGLHRTVKLPDLIIAATAERHGVTVLHYDRDFERIAEVTGQPVEWVVPPGTADLPLLLRNLSETVLAGGPEDRNRNRFDRTALALGSFGQPVVRLIVQVQQQLLHVDQYGGPTDRRAVATVSRRNPGLRPSAAASCRCSACRG